MVGGFYTPPPISLVETWLERSANVPITIVAQSPNSDEKDEKLYQYYLSLFSVLKFHLARWGSLTVNVSSHVLPTILPTSFSAAAQLLKLEITAVVGYLAEGIIDLVPLLDTAPSLRHLRYELDFVKTFEILPNPYSLLPRATTVQSLVHFELSTALTLHSMLRVLGECRSATHVTLKSEFLNWQNDPHANEPPLRRFQLPHLQSLVLKVSGTECHLLDLVHCPNLKLLNLNYFDAQSPSVPQNLRPLFTFLANAPESLQVLVVYAFGNVTVEVLKMFSLSRLYNLRIVEFAPLKPLTQEAAESLRMKIRDEGKGWELKFTGAGWSKWDPRVALGWVDVELHRQWQDTLRDLRVNSFLVVDRHRL